MRAGSMPRWCTIRALQKSLMVTTASARRAARSYVTARYARSARPNRSGRSRCWTSSSVTTLRWPPDRPGTGTVNG